MIYSSIFCLQEIHPYSLALKLRFNLSTSSHITSNGIDQYYDGRRGRRRKRRREREADSPAFLYFTLFLILLFLLFLSLSLPYLSLSLSLSSSSFSLNQSTSGRSPVPVLLHDCLHQPPTTCGLSPLQTPIYYSNSRLCQS